MSQPVYDDFFNDPRADTVIKSASGKHYRISSWVLSKQSSYFEDLQDMIFLDKSEPYEIDIHDDLLKAMLRSANFNEPITNAFDCKRLQLNVLIPLHKFFDKWRFDESRDVLDRELARRADTDPWTLLFEASKCNNLCSAVMAVAKLHPGRLITINFWIYIGRLRTEWQSPFLFAVFDTQTRTDSLSSVIGKSNAPFMRWSCKHHSEDLAERFEKNVNTMETSKKASANRKSS